MSAPSNANRNICGRHCRRRATASSCSPRKLQFRTVYLPGKLTLANQPYRTVNMLNPGPLPEEEIEELDQFLLYAEGAEESMYISTLDGFLTAVVSGPKTIMPSEWLRWVWDMERGKDAPEFKDHAQAQ